MARTVRPSSPTYGRWEALRLDDRDHHQLYVPVGFAHGFCVLSEVADVAYRQSGYYELEGVDEEGWPHFRQLKALPVMGLLEQENFLKDHILLFFENSDLDERESDGHDEL